MIWTVYHTGLLMSDRAPIELLERKKTGHLIRDSKGRAKPTGKFEGTVNGGPRRGLSKAEFDAAWKLDAAAHELFKRAERGEILLAQRRNGEVCDYLWREKNEPSTSRRLTPLENQRLARHFSRPARSNITMPDQAAHQRSA